MMKVKANAFDALNPAQRRAATFGTVVPEKGVSAGPLLILAGAGTGKTNTLAHRTAHLVLNGTDPSRIMMLTFTRRAAQEMIKRTQTIVTEVLSDRGKGGDRSVVSRLTWSGTFHSVGGRILPCLTAQTPRISWMSSALIWAIPADRNAFRARIPASRFIPIGSTPGYR